MSKKLIRSIAQTLELLKIPDLSRQSKKFYAETAELKTEFSSIYEEYTSRISTKEVAISLNTASFLYWVCKILQPVNILDTGSGFSSYLLRKYAKRNNATCWSVDDDANWLMRTRGFLTESDLSTENLLLWTDFMCHRDVKFQLIFHDIGSLATRKQTLTEVFERMAPGRSWLIFDDIHFKDYAKLLQSEAISRNLKYQELSALTGDNLGRYAAFVWRV